MRRKKNNRNKTTRKLRVKVSVPMSASSEPNSALASWRRLKKGLAPKARRRTDSPWKSQSGGKSSWESRLGMRCEVLVYKQVAEDALGEDYEMWAGGASASQPAGTRNMSFKRHGLFSRHPLDCHNSSRSVSDTQRLLP